MNCKGLIVAALMLATPFCATAERGIVSNSKEVTFSIISPKDGSLWIATGSRGLIRLGATGRPFVYSSATGAFPCDSIVALAFSTDGTLYMKDACGGVYAYTTLSGFTLQNEVPADVAFDSGEILDSQEAELQTVISQRKKLPTWVVWMIIIGFCCVVAYYRIRKIREDHVSKVSLQEQELKKELTEELPKPARKEPEALQVFVQDPEPVLSADPDFVSRVEEIVMANFTDPAYSVETLADTLGITRVHLNRKLKEAGAPAPKLILKKARMDKALTMLREGLPVSDVYAACGFSSASYFSSAFKEYFGYTPREVTKS